MIAMMPKAKGDPYFVSCQAGAEEAARELGVDLIWDGPTGLDAARQNEMVENWITRGVDVIAVAVLRKIAARAAPISGKNGAVSQLPTTARMSAKPSSILPSARAAHAAAARRWISICSAQ